MRLNKFTVENMMKYLYGEQISAIPERNYNIDMKTKYLDFGASYLYACHGNREQQMKKWIRERLVYTDTLMKYTSSTNDYITLRSSKLGRVYLDLETYIPMYLTVKWRDEPDLIVGGEIVNNGKQTKKVKKGEKVRFEFNMPTATDQEIIIYAGRYLKSIGDVSNLQPTTMLLANANKLTTIICHSPNLINTDLSKLQYIQNIDLSKCTALGSGIGAQPTLDLATCGYLKKINITDTRLTAIYTNLAGGSIEEILYPTTIQSITLRNQERLKVIGLPYGQKNMLNDSERKDNIDYDWTDRKINNPAITGNNNATSFIVPVKVIYDTVYKFKMPTHGGTIFVYEFDEQGNFIGRPAVKIESYGLKKGTYSPSKPNVFQICISATGWNAAQRKACVMAISGEEDIFLECATLANVDIQNCPIADRLTMYKLESGEDSFLSLKHVQNLTLKNAFSISVMKFGSFKRLINLSLANMDRLVSCGFDDMNSIGDTAVLGNITIQNCALLETITFNVTSASKLILFAQNSKLDLSQLFTLKRIISNTAIKGLKTIILNKGIEDILLQRTFGNETSDLKNLWSYSVATENENSGYLGIDFKGINVKNIDLSSALLIPNSKNMNVAPTTAFNINPNRDGKIYPFLVVNGTIDLTNYTGSCAGLFKNVDLNTLTFIKNNDFIQTDFSSMFEGATLSPNFDITSLISKMKKAENFSNMFAGSNIASSNIKLPATIENISGMFKGCTRITEDIDIPFKIRDTSEIFKDCINITKVRSNWKKTYEVISIKTDGAYNGCTGITTCDGVLLELNEYTTGLDGIPVEWGGYGFDDNSTTIVIVKTPADNYVIGPHYHMSMPLIADGIVNWGDGTITVGQENHKHTYKKAGKYVIKGKLMFSGNYGPSDEFKNSLIEIIKLPSGYNHAFAFFNCSNLTKVRSSNFAPTNMVAMFSGCTSLIDIDVSNWNLSNCTETTGIFTGCVKLTSLNVSNWDTSRVTNMANTFINCPLLTTIDVSKWDTSKVIKMNDMFNGCSSLTSINVSNFNTSNVTSINGMFANCRSLSSLNISNFNTSKVTNMNGFFEKCELLTEIQGVKDLNTSQVTTMRTTFLGCKNILSLDFTKWNTSKVTDMYALLSSCSELTEIIGFNKLNLAKLASVQSIFEGTFNYTAPIDLSNVNRTDTVNFSRAFYKCATPSITGVEGIKLTYNTWATFQEMPNITSLDLSGIDTSNVKTMSTAWQSYVHGNPNLTYLNISNLDTLGFELSSNVNDQANMSYFCMDNPKLKTIVADNCNISNVKNTYRIFESNPELETIDVSSWDFGNVVNVSGMNAPFRNCRKLTNLTSFKNIRQDFTCDASNLLTVASLMSIINSLVNVGRPRVLTIGRINMLKLTADQIRVATNKNWTVV